MKKTKKRGCGVLLKNNVINGNFESNIKELSESLKNYTDIDLQRKIRTERKKLEEMAESEFKISNKIISYNLRQQSIIVNMLLQESFQRKICN